MKRTLALLMAVILLIIGFSPSTFAKSYQEHPISIAHVFDVKPNSAEWLAMDNVVEKRAACFVSDNELKMMTTTALMLTVLEYPLLVDMYAYNTIDEGIEAVSMYFGGIRELLTRKDAQKCLVEYASRSKSRNEHTPISYFYADTLLHYIAEKTVSENIALPKVFLAGMIYTPNGTPVQGLVYGNPNVYYALTWTDHGFYSAAAIGAVTGAYVGAYPNARGLRDNNPAYNCHSYAWHSQLSSNKYWINYPNIYIDDGSYVSADASKNNKVTYRSHATGRIIHSGIISNYSNSTITVTSKWGAFGLFEHRLNDCPYYTGSTIQYWQRNK